MKQFLETPFTEPRYFLLLLAIFFSVIFLRYLFFSGIYHYLFYHGLGGRFRKRLINGPELSLKQAKTEVFRSAMTSLVFALSGVVMIILWQEEVTLLYYDWSDYPAWYHPLSFLAALFLHETYYYWLHRWMHWPKVYRIVHKWHHDSIVTSSLTSFSFHPFEALIQAAFIPLLLLVLPLHLYLLFALLLIMTLSGTINHAGVEIYPQGSAQRGMSRWIIGATHHDQHHKYFRANFGLYFTFWDRWMGTERKDFKEVFDRNTQ